MHPLKLQPRSESQQGWQHYQNIPPILKWSTPQSPVVAEPPDYHPAMWGMGWFHPTPPTRLKRPSVNWMRRPPTQWVSGYIYQMIIWFSCIWSQGRRRTRSFANTFSGALAIKRSLLQIVFLIEFCHFEDFEI